MLLGYKNVGKTAFLKKYCINNHASKNTIGIELYKYYYFLKNNIHTITFYDTSSDKIYYDLIKTYAITVDLILLFVDVSNYSSLINISQYNNLIKNKKVFIICNKIDKSYNKIYIKNHIQKLITRYNYISEYYISVKNGNGIEKLINYCIMSYYINDLPIYNFLKKKEDKRNNCICYYIKNVCNKRNIS